MKILACLAAILVVSEAGYPHLSVLRALGREDSGVSLLAFPSYSENCVSNTLRECTSCSEAKLCLPNGLPIAKINCSQYSSSTPYCNPEDGLCTANAPLSCVTSPFQCPSQDGIYPDPENCAQFHYCTNGVATTVSCPKNNVYDHNLRTCKLRRWPLDCVKFNCANKEGQDIVYPKDDRIWATCAGGKAYIMGRCEEYESYNVAQKKCIRVCRTVENQPIKGVCDSYIRCAEVGIGQIQAVTFPCPPGEGFDEVTKQCSTEASCLDATDDTEPGDETESVAQSRIINNSGSNNANNNVENGNDNVDGNLVNGNNNGNNHNSGNVGSGNRAAPLSRINNSGNDNVNNNVTNGNDGTNGNLVNGNDNSGNINAGNIGSGNRAAPLSRINNSGNDNANNNVTNGDDDTNGNLVNGNNNFGNTNAGNIGSGNRAAPLSRINNSGNDNANNNVANGDDNTNGNLVNGNGNSGNTNAGNIGSGNRAAPLSRINNSGNDNANNNVANGDDNTNGNLVNGNKNSENINSGNIGSLNQGKLSLRIINSAGNNNTGNNISNGDDEVNGTLINGNDNGNNVNSGNIGSGNQHGLSSRIINSSGNSNSNQTIVNGNDNTNGNVINGNNNNNNENSNNTGTGNGHDGNGDPEGNNGNGGKKDPPNFMEYWKNLLEWLKNQIG